MRAWSRRAWGALGVAASLLGGCGSGSYDDFDAYQAAVHDSRGDEAAAGSAADLELPLARGGIEIARVQANQGVGVLIGADGEALDPDDRAAPLIKGRMTLVRAFWTLPHDWEPRPIEGRLVLTAPDGTRDVLTHTTWVEHEAMDADLSRSFFWELSESQTRPGVSFRVELHEGAAGHEDLPAPSPGVRLPQDGHDAPLGVRSTELAMKVVVVPFHYDDGAGCVTAPDTSEDTMRRFADAIYMRNPLERVDLEVHAPIDWDTPLDSFVPLNSYMAGLRFDEGALPETYYYGLIDVCSGGLGGAGGLANGIPTEPVSEAAASQRVSSGLSLDPDWSAETFVHEVGHSQGRRHVACNGEEGGPDPSYPHQGGDVGEWGFGVVDFGLRSPASHKDYMSYCQPVWVGAWGWNEVYPVIEGLSAWGATPRSGEAPAPEAEAAGDDAGDDADPYGGSLLLGAIEPSGREHWLTVPGLLPVTQSGGSTRLELRRDDQLLAEVPAHVQPMQDGAGILVMAELPPQWSAVTSVTRVDGQVRAVVARPSIVEHHQARAIRRSR
ncbi:MAG: hypothetical protein KDK70_01545 [Myxococcales bacterium]|nr:hypothetical protein [Myxococcales bacterium]